MDDISQLKLDFADEQKKKEKQRPFLLFELAGGKENAHTRVLKAILNFNEHMFLNSFLSILGLSCNADSNCIEITDQMPALGLKDKSKGFIDLFISFKDVNGDEHKLVIENKVFGAGDSENQLNRYIATIKENPCGSLNEFKKWLGQLTHCTSNDLKNCHLVYLTLDGGEPEEKSLASELKKMVDYQEINYVDNIIPWIREKVLPECPYHDNGLTITGLIQYLAALEHLNDNGDKLSDVVIRFLNKQDDKDSDKYNKVLEVMKGIKSVESNESLEEYEFSDMLWAELKKAAEEIYSNDVEKPWILHFTPSFLCLYKPEWMNIGKRKYSIPFVHFFLPNVISKKKSSPSWDKWELKFEHLNPLNDELKNYNTYLTNHNKTIGIKLNEITGSKEANTLIDSDETEQRKEYFESVIKCADGIVNIIDKCIIDIRNQQLDDDNEIAFALLKYVFGELKLGIQV